MNPTVAALSRAAVALAAALAVAACTPPDAPPADPAAEATPEDVAAIEDAATASAPATADAPAAGDVAAMPAPPEASTPPSAPPAYDATIIGFDGYRGAAFGADEAAVRAAHPGALADTIPPDEPGGCYYVVQPGESGYALGFMFEQDRFVRVDVETHDVVAPGGLAVGMGEDDVRAAFPAMETQPHHYTDGKYLVVSPPDGGDARLVFETDAAGRIERWRIGLPPPVHYVEGCS